MTIYFAGSISGGRDDQPLYFEIIKKLSNYGAVATEHVANKELSSYGETSLSDEAIYSRDVAWLTEADVVVAEITTPSLGVGYELGYAEALRKKVLCIYRKSEGRKISSMIVGDNFFATQVYKDLADLDEIFENFFATTKNMV
jgi:2'-deoxynucleoside 5'-phosphate N-hydrolase